jgi:hypothetical protein
MKGIREGIRIFLSKNSGFPLPVPKELNKFSRD